MLCQFGVARLLIWLRALVRYLSLRSCLFSPPVCGGLLDGIFQLFRGLRLRLIGNGLKVVVIILREEGYVAHLKGA